MLLVKNQKLRGINHENVKFPSVSLRFSLESFLKQFLPVWGGLDKRTSPPSQPGNSAFNIVLGLFLDTIRKEIRFPRAQGGHGCSRIVSQKREKAWPWL